MRFWVFYWMSFGALFAAGFTSWPVVVLAIADAFVLDWGWAHERIGSAE